MYVTLCLFMIGLSEQRDLGFAWAEYDFIASTLRSNQDPVEALVPGNRLLLDMLTSSCYQSRVQAQKRLLRLPNRWNVLVALFHDRNVEIRMRASQLLKSAARCGYCDQRMNLNEQWVWDKEVCWIFWFYCGQCRYTQCPFIAILGNY